MYTLLTSLFLSFFRSVALRAKSERLLSVEDLLFAGVGLPVCAAHQRFSVFARNSNSNSHDNVYGAVIVAVREFIRFI